MNADEIAFLDVAVARGILTLDARSEVESLARAIADLGQPLGLRDILEIKGFLSDQQISEVEQALTERNAPALAVARPGQAAPKAAAPAPAAKPAGGPTAPAKPAPAKAAPGPADGLARMASPAPELPGYEISRQLGQSLVGPIYLGRHVATKRLVTIKLIRHETLANGERRHRMLDMGERLQKVSGPHVVDIIDVSMLPDGRALVASAAVEGQSLKTKLQAGLPHRRLLRIALGMARGLEVLHQVGVIHGGVRPENVFLEHGQRVRLAGHELNALLRALGADMPHPRIAEPYRAPELAPGRASKQGDIYAFGAVLYRGYTDKGPGADPPRLAEVLAAADDRVDELVMSCLSPEPVRRPTIERILKVLEPLAGAAAMEKVRD